MADQTVLEAGKAEGGGDQETDKNTKTLHKNTEV